ncbi:hypothetical protein BDZ90DRAFT_229134, partial [Jaminaea rosea]
MLPSPLSLAIDSTRLSDALVWRSRNDVRGQSPRRRSTAPPAAPRCFLSHVAPLPIILTLTLTLNTAMIDDRGSSSLRSIVAFHSHEKSLASFAEIIVIVFDHH